MRKSRRFPFTRHLVISATLVLFTSAVFTGLAGAGGGGTPPGQMPPSASSLPTITGTAVEGQTLTASPGDWTGSALDFSIQWNRCSSTGASCAPVSGAVGTSYRLGADDVGSTLRISVAAVNKRGTATATSPATAVVAAAPAPAPPSSATAPANTSLPQIVGTPQVGTAVSATSGSWSGSPTSYAYQWKRCDGAGAGCVAISGATAATYAPALSDAGTTLRVSVSASNAVGTAVAESPQSSLMSTATQAPLNTTLPQVVGSPKAGQSSASSVGTWSGSPTSYAYQWKRCDGSGAGCVSIVGATAGSYTPVATDAGATLRVAVSATGLGGTTVAQSLQSAPVASATTSAPIRFGTSTGWKQPWLSSTDQARNLDSQKAMGAQIVRFDINWTSIQNGGPTSYNWAPFDAVVQGLNARGMKALGMIAYTPAWARPAGTTDKYAPTNVADYANFCEATARHYAPMGVHNWEVWNEPNLSAFFQPRPDVAKYTAMLKGCYARIKAVDPAATVVTGGTAPALACTTSTCATLSPVQFLQGVYANGGGGSFDAVGHHPYSFPYAPSTIADWSAWYQMFGTNPSLRSVMTANGDSAKKIWGTEWGAPTNGPLGSGFVSESVQAAHVTEAYRLFGSYSWAGPLFVYNFHDNGADTSTKENFFGMIRYDWSQKPGYAAYRAAATGS
jgi:polysaccharide biosynthesis protein PslG